MKGSVDGVGGRPGENGGKRAEIYTYDCADDVYGMNWSNRKDKKWRLAVGSYKEDTENYVEIITLDDEAGGFVSDPMLKFHHRFPPTKIMFMPEKMAQSDGRDLLITTSDYLRVFNIEECGVRQLAHLNNNKSDNFCSPLTSFDWNEVSTNRLGTSSIDCTCTIWDLEKMVVETQMIAHDSSVNDFAWGGAGVFASVSSDGSVRVFDLRDKEHSTIIFEAPAPVQPLLRLGWNKQDPRYMATIIMGQPQVFILDIRYPATPVAELQRHQEYVNALAWAPHSAAHICTAGQDSQALIWDMGAHLGQGSEPNPDPILAYGAGSPVNQLQWSSLQPDWVAICFDNKTQILRV